MRRLYVLYDEHCELCRRLKNWLLGQSSWITLGLVAAGSAEAQRMFPGLDQIAGASDLAVVTDAGEVYLNNHAWIMCLYALEEYRDWALRLASPMLLPLARRAFDALSKNRAAISRWIGASEQELVRELDVVEPPACSTGSCTADATAPAKIENTVRDYLQ
jgi:predicted DCC family thiol-disulfide oxidoreductase YuxK